MQKGLFSDFKFAKELLKLEEDYKSKTQTNIGRSSKKGVMKNLIQSYANNTYLQRLRMQ